jgi:hypothetical protein
VISSLARQVPIWFFRMENCILNVFFSSSWCRAKLPADLTESMLRTLENQALGQGVELQLGFAVDNLKASLAVKRRLACEHVKVWEEVNCVLSINSGCFDYCLNSHFSFSLSCLFFV